MPTHTRDDHWDCVAGNIAESTLHACLHLSKYGQEYCFHGGAYDPEPRLHQQRTYYATFGIAATLWVNVSTVMESNDIINHPKTFNYYISQLIWAPDKQM